MITFIINHFTMLSILSALLTQASCWLFTVTVVSSKNTYTVATAGAARLLQTLTSTTTRNHSLAVSLHRDANSNAPLVRIAPDMPSKDVRRPLWLTWHSLCDMATSDPISYFTNLSSGTGQLFTFQLPRGLAHTLGLTVFVYHRLAHLETHSVERLNHFSSRLVNGIFHIAIHV